MSLNKYAEVAKIEFLNSLAYFYEFIAGAGFIAIILFVFYNMWSVVYKFSGTAIISGFSFATLMWFLLMSGSVTFTDSGRPIGKKISEEIKSGEIAYSLNKPYNFIAYNYAYYIGPALTSIFITFALGFALFAFLVGLPAVNPAIIPFVTLTVILSVTINFLIYFSIGLLSLWFEDNSAFLWMQQKFVFILGGMLMPLEFFPKILQDIAINLPFAYIAYAPAKLFVNFTSGLFIQTVFMQLLWIGIFAAIAVALFRFGSKKVSINGG
ncbi:MAG: hypothetical protein WA139_00105 [Candidatus Aenigmatarchaeota archaeon]